MDNMFYIVTGLLGFLLSGMWYATNILLLNIFANKGWKAATPFSALLASLLPLAAISLYRGYLPLNLHMLFNYQLWAIVFVTLIITCLDILVQPVLLRQPIKKEILIELIASFIFSMGIGYVFYSSECFLFGVLAHIAERMISNLSKNGTQEYAVRHKKNQND